ncbi:unnamed protein product, partial [Meganyctiphanes norvegica]
MRSPATALMILHNWEVVANKVEVDLVCEDVAPEINEHVQMTDVGAFPLITPKHVSEEHAVPYVPKTIKTTTDTPNQGSRFKIHLETQRQTKVKRTVIDCVSCPECGKSYASNANLKDHIRIHTGVRPFVCDECGMTFTQRSNLRMHKRIHAGERPYMCGVCGKTFSRSTHLPGHMRQHTGEKPYTCQDCNQSFTTNHSLKNHMRIHTGEKPYTCDICDALFTRKSTLSAHKKSHNGEKNYKCNICHKSFVLRSGLNEHMIVHSQEKAFQCEQCHKSFKYSNYLSKHKKKYCKNDGYRKRWQKTGANSKETNHSDTVECEKNTLLQTNKNSNIDNDSESLSIYEKSEVFEKEIYNRHCEPNTLTKKIIPMQLIDNGDWKKAWIKQGYK